MQALAKWIAGSASLHWSPTKPDPKATVRSTRQQAKTSTTATQAGAEAYSCGSGLTQQTDMQMTSVEWSLFWTGDNLLAELIYASGLDALIIQFGLSFKTTINVRVSGHEIQCHSLFSSIDAITSSEALGSHNKHDLPLKRGLLDYASPSHNNVCRALLVPICLLRHCPRNIH